MNPLHLFYITNIRIMQDITNGRCGWCGTDELYVKYHDQEWGKLVTDDKTLFEFLVLESAQAGLNWITILKKREGYRKAFYNFDAELVAQMTDEDVERLMQFEGIVKNRLKIKSTITNAKLFLAVQKEFGSFYKVLSKILCKWKQDSAASLFLYLDSVLKLVHNQTLVMNRLYPFLLNFRHYSF